MIKEAENIRQCKLFFEDRGVEQESEPEEFRSASYDYWDLRDVIRDETLTLEERGDGVSELEKLAGNGDRHSQYLMGKLWRDGPLLTPNTANARYWFQQAAEQGHSYAQYALGKLLLSDDVEVRDPAEGMSWLETAAQNGNDYAAYRLGKEYYRGKMWSAVSLRRQNGLTVRHRTETSTHNTCWASCTSWARAWSTTNRWDSTG